MSAGVVVLFFLFKQKTAYELRISDWSSDVCSSDLKRCERAASRWVSPAAEASLARGSSPRPAATRRHDHARARFSPSRWTVFGSELSDKIGRASCRDRGCQYV